jgi:hypothetical protein
MSNLYCKTKNGEVFKVWSDNPSEQTMNVYPVEDIFDAESTNTTAIDYHDIACVDSNFPLLSSLPTPFLTNLKVGQWSLSFSKLKDVVTITALHDGSPVSDVQADLGGDEELFYRLTSRSIENDYRVSGDVDAILVKETVRLANWEIEVISDEDNHLNVYCRNIVSDSLAELSVTDENSETDKFCIVITDSAYLH